MVERTELSPLTPALSPFGERGPDVGVSPLTPALSEPAGPFGERGPDVGVSPLTPALSPFAERALPEIVRFWGVRGSIASPGPSTALVGGNTTCVEVRLGGQRFVLDGGTGLRELGAAQGHEPLSATLLFSHLHWDHIQGIPFFGPLFDARSRVTMRGPAGLAETLYRQMERPSFPVGMDVMGAAMDIDSVEPGGELTIGGVGVRVALLPHPGGSFGYRIEHAGRAVVFATDVEMTDAPHPALVDLAKDADVLIVDAQYVPEEMAAKRGWGHSSFDVVCRLADEARVRQLVLTHHDPSRDDAAVLAVEARAQRLRSDARAAREGMTIDLRTGAIMLAREEAVASVSRAHEPALAGV